MVGSHRAEGHHLLRLWLQCVHCHRSGGQSGRGAGDRRQLLRRAKWTPAPRTTVRSRSRPTPRGLRILAASGDAGAAACDDFQGSEPLATRGLSVNFPGGDARSYGRGRDGIRGGDRALIGPPPIRANFGSALSYIPETAWNESSTSRPALRGGGASVLYSQPAWQTGPGVPDDSARHVPDISLSAALHDALRGYLLGQQR